MDQFYGYSSIIDDGNKIVVKWLVWAKNYFLTDDGFLQVANLKGNVRQGFNEWMER